VTGMMAPKAVDDHVAADVNQRQIFHAGGGDECAGPVLHLESPEIVPPWRAARRRVSESPPKATKGPT
jgi:hypothetical protein